MVRRAVPASRRCVAKAWRRAWMPPRFVIPALGRVVELLGRRGVQRPLAIAAREQPEGGPVLAPVGPEFRQEAGGEERVAVLAPLALLHPQAPSLGIEVAEWEPDHLADPEPGGVGGGQERPLLAGGRAREQAPHLRGAQDLGEPLRLPRARDREGRRRTTERRVVEEPECLHGDTTGAPGQLLVAEHVGQVRLDLRGGS